MIQSLQMNTIHQNASQEKHLKEIRQFCSIFDDNQKCVS